MKKLFLLAANIMLLCKFFTSVVLAHYHEKNFISDERIFRAKTVRCVYPTVAVTNWDKIDEPSLGIDEQDPGLEYTFDSIGQQKARLIGNVGASDVIVLRTRHGLHLLEILPAGSINTTTIYSGRENVPGGYFASVASRHPYIIGPSPSQRYGKCKVLEYHQ